MAERQIQGEYQAQYQQVVGRPDQPHDREGKHEKRREHQRQHRTIPQAIGHQTGHGRRQQGDGAGNGIDHRHRGERQATSADQIGNEEGRRACRSIDGNRHCACQKHLSPVGDQRFAQGRLHRVMASRQLREFGGVLHPPAQQEGDQSQRHDKEEGDPPAIAVHLRGRQKSAGGCRDCASEKRTRRHAQRRHRRQEPAPRGRSRFYDQRHRSHYFRTGGKPLSETKDDEEDRRGQTDRRMARQQTDQGGAQAHEADRHHQRRPPPAQIANAPEQDAPQGTADEAHAIDRQPRQKRGVMAGPGKEERREIHQQDVEDGIVVEFDEAARKCGDRGPPRRRRNRFLCHPVPAFPHEVSDGANIFNRFRHLNLPASFECATIWRFDAGQGLRMELPLSTGSRTPVIWDESSLTRKSVARAMSQASPSVLRAVKRGT